jgi:hypothetical protein
VNLGVAKDQRLSLNPSQISGACGRLMCCLRYEHEFYVQSRKRFPKEGRLVKTKKGEEKILSNDIFRERVTLRAEDGEVRIVALAELRDEMEALGVTLPVVAPAASAHDDDDSEIVEAQELAVEEVELDAPIAVVSETAELPVPGAEPQTDGERRPHRRRGRRGGRRNRQGRGGGSRGSNDDAPPEQN